MLSLPAAFSRRSASAMTASRMAKLRARLGSGREFSWEALWLGSETIFEAAILSSRAWAMAVTKYFQDDRLPALGAIARTVGRTSKSRSAPLSISAWMGPVTQSLGAGSLSQPAAFRKTLSRFSARSREPSSAEGVEEGVVIGGAGEKEGEEVGGTSVCGISWEDSGFSAYFPRFFRSLSFFFRASLVSS